MENLKIKSEDIFADASKVQGENSKELIELRKKQAQELAEKRKRYNEEVENIRDKQLRDRQQKEESNAKKLTKSRKSERRERTKEYLRSKKELSKKDPNKKNKDYTKLKDQFNPNSDFRGAGRLLQWTGADKAARRFIATTQGNFSDTEDSYSSKEAENSKLRRWFKEKWVNVKTGKACGRKTSNKGEYPACRPSIRVNSDTPKTSTELSKEERDKFIKIKKSQKRIPYNHKKTVDKNKNKYSKNTPKDKELYSRVISKAKGKFNKWPSAYASGWVVKEYKRLGGKYSDNTYSMLHNNLERDELLINGFLPEVSLIEDVESGKRSKDRFYLEALDRIIEFKKSKLNKNSIDKTYSAWKLLSRLCENKNS